MISQLYVMATLASGQVVQFHPERILNPAPEYVPNRIYSLVLIGWAVFRLWPNCANQRMHSQLKVELLLLAVGAVVLRFVQ
jgi:hypothetical protein